MAEILKDRSRNNDGAPASIKLIPGVVWPTQQKEPKKTPVPPTTPEPTEQISPTTPVIIQTTATPTAAPTATKWLYIPPTATIPPPPENTATATSTATATATSTPTSTSTATATPTETATEIPPNVNFGPPDGSLLNIPDGGECIIDLEAETGSPLNTSSPDGAYDLVMYEYVPSPGIIMFDHIVIQLGTGPTGACSSSAWTTVLYWGDGDASNNGQLGSLYPGEIDNQTIPFAHLYNGSTPGIAIDADALGGSGIYPCLRIFAPVSGDGDAAQVDSIEILP